MVTGRYTPEQLIRELRGFGLDLFVGDDGVVHGRFREKGKHMTLEMRAVADELSGMNDEVAALLKSEPERVSLTGVTVEHLESEWGPKVKSGEWRLEGKVIFHRETGLCDLTMVKEARA